MRGVRAYGLYAVSILSFYLQFATPTSGMLDRERAARRRVLQGPWN